MIPIRKCEYKGGTIPRLWGLGDRVFRVDGSGQAVRVLGFTMKNGGMESYNPETLKHAETMNPEP